MIKQQQSLPLKSFIRINLKGNSEMFDNSLFQNKNDVLSTSTIVVNNIDQVSTIFDIIGANSSQFKLIYNEKILCPALSFAFYNISNNDNIIVVESQKYDNSSYIKQKKLISNLEFQSNQTSNVNYISLPQSMQLNHNHSLIHSKSTSILENIIKSSDINQMKKESDFSNQWPNEKYRDVKSNYNLQQFHDSINPITSHESARLTDLYRSRIESNTKSFRKLCSKYHALVNSDSSIFSNNTTTFNKSHLMEKSSSKNCKNNSSSMETVLPEKPSFPSTDFLPTFSSINQF